MKITLKTVLVAFFIFGLTACDKNISENSALLSITASIDTLAITPNEIAQGESATIEVKVEDPDGQVSSVTLSGVGQIKQASDKKSFADTKTVTPSVSTTYKLEVYAVVDGVSTMVRSREAYLRVNDAAGNDTANAAVSATTETICNDGKDDDSDDAIDCDDSDCGSDAECTGPDYAISGLTFSPAAPTPGDSVTATWTGTDCSNYKVYLNTAYVAAGETASYTFSTSATAATYALIVACVGEDGGEHAYANGSVETKEAEEAETGFAGTIRFWVSPSIQVLAGQSYTLFWEVSNATSVKLNGTLQGGVSSGSYTASASDMSVGEHSFTLSVADNGDPVVWGEQSITVRVRGFSENVNATNVGSVVQVTGTATKGEYYVLSTNALYRSTDYLKTIAPFGGSFAGTATTLAVSSDGTVYVGTTDGLYQSTGDALSLMLSPSTVEIQAILPRAGSSDVLVATSGAHLYRVFASTDGTCGTNNPYPPTSAGYCANETDWTGDEESPNPVSVSQFVPNVKHSESAVAVNTDGTAILSTDAGSNFTESLSQVTGGYWKNNNFGFLWNSDNDTLWEYSSDSSDYFVVSSGLDLGMSGIRFVTKIRDHRFVAASAGVWFESSAGEWSLTDLTDDVVFLDSHLLNVSSSSSGELSVGSHSMKEVCVAGNDNVEVIAVTSRGTIQSLSWNANSDSRDFSGVFNFCDAE